MNSTRQQDILQKLALMLESSNHARITTAALAREVGFSEAALYKHFPSKTKMYEGLLDFTEEAIFSRINAISRDGTNTSSACAEISLVILTFAERNPGITRLICGDALHGEDARLQSRASNFFQRLHSELKQIIKMGEIRESLTTAIPPGMTATIMVNIVEGRLHQYVRSQFSDKPTTDWGDCWPAIERGLLLS